MVGIIAAVDIGATKITASLCSVEGMLVRLHQSTKLTGDEAAIPRQVKELIGECLRRTGKDLGSLSAVGISTAGPFRRIDGRLELVSPNICGGMNPDRGILPNDWSSIPLEAELEGQFGMLHIENDAVAGAVAERTFGAGRGHDDLVYVTWSTGIGTGAFVDGRPIHGKNGNAPHGGHVYLGDSGPVCGCGNVCDLESVASGTAISLQYGKGAGTAEVFEACRKGDPRAGELIRHVAVSFGRGLASINSVLDTGVFIIGGSVFMNNVDILLPLVREEFQRSFPALSEGVDIIPSELGKYLGDVAALCLVIPEEWIGPWSSDRPWERAPETVFIT